MIVYNNEGFSNNIPYVDSKIMNIKLKITQKSISMFILGTRSDLLRNPRVLGT